MAVCCIETPDLSLRPRVSGFSSGLIMIIRGLNVIIDNEMIQDTDRLCNGDDVESIDSDNDVIFGGDYW